MPVIDDEETLILEEESRSKMSEKAKDPEVIAKKISHKPIDYEKLNSLTDDFEKRFSPQQELSAEQAFWFHILNPSIESSYTPPVIVEVPSELPKVSLVNASLKKLKFHLTQFDSVVKKRTTPNALEEGEWGFEHTKTVFNNEIIPFLKSLKDIFNVFDKDLLNEITEVQTVFDQMDAAVQQSLVDKQCLEIAKKEILLENDRLLQKIMSQDVLLTVINSMSWNNDSVNMEMQTCDSCEKFLNLDDELSKSKQAYNDLLKNYSQLEKHYRLQDKDTTICKLKDTIKSLRENTKEENVNLDKCDLEPINKELENSVAKLLSENERLFNEINHVKQVFKDQFDSIKQTRVRHKEQRKEIVENVVHIPSSTTIALGMFKLSLEPLPTRLLQNREVHLDYLRNTQEQANILREIVEQAKAKQPLDSELDLACKYAIRIQELLVYVQDTCPNAIEPSAKKVTSKPMNNVKKVRFAEPLTSSSNIKQVESSNTSDSNTLVLSSTGVKCSTSNCGSKPSSNKRNDRISQPPSSNKKNKVEAQPRKVNKVNRVVKPVCDVDVKHSLSKANSEILCATCNKSMFDGVHDKCLLDLVQNGNKRTKSAKKHIKQNIWKPTGHVFTDVGFKWKPTGRIFTIVGNSCPLTRITSTNIVLWYLDSGCSKHMTGNCSQLMNFVSKFLGTVRFGNDQIARIMGYGDYQLGNVIISRVYYVEGLRHNLFFVGQFCDADLKVAFHKNTCFIQNLEGVDLLSGSRDTNLYTISLDDMLKSSPICLLFKASKTKSWLWHRRLSHLNFGTLDKLAKDGLAQGIPRLKFQKDHLCSACALGKSRKSSHQPKAEDINQEKQYLLHMDLCGLMCVASINGKRYILVIVDDYSRFTWVRFLKTKDEAPAAIIKCIKNIQVCFKATIQNVRTDNGTEFVNQTLHEWYENVGIMHQTFIARTRQQNADIRIFVGYAAAKKVFRIYNRRTWIITETIHVTFDELTAMASEQFSSGPGLQGMTPATSSTRLGSNPVSQQPCLPPIRDDWDRLFQPMFDEYFNPPTIDVFPVPEAAAPRAEVLADYPVSTSIDQDAPSITNVIGDPSRFVSTRKQLETDAMWCYFDAFLTSIEPKNFKQAMTEPSWIDALQEEIHEFERLEV
ncbi:retrovirus-related pol polyprotein from transposon TNT 1-94 [Tanacetum coccineum]